MRPRFNSRHDLAYLLTNVVDPNAVIRPEYQSQVVLTDDGLTLTGLLAESTPKTITILDAKNQRTVIARAEIDEMETSKLSLMPEDVFDEVSQQDIRDLFAYLQTKTERPADRSLASLGIAGSTFATGVEGWTIADNGAGGLPEFQAADGAGGGWLRFDDLTGGKMAAVAPGKFLGDLTRYDGGELSFDARVVDARGGSAHACFGVIAITGSGRTVRADVAPGQTIPGHQWTTYRAELTAEVFRVDPATWRSVLADAEGIAITVEAFAGSSESMGLDNVILRLP